jgi:CheY-like chemotaxis protein
VVDDNEVNLEYMRVLLEEAGHDVQTADGGMEALRILETRLVDAVFLDIQMPGMSGLELARRIRKSPGSRFPADIPLIALTAFDPAELEDPEIRFDGVFNKPVDIRRLLSAGGCRPGETGRRLPRDVQRTTFLGSWKAEDGSGHARRAEGEAALGPFRPSWSRGWMRTLPAGRTRMRPWNG